MRCLAKRPSERYQTWPEVEDALQELRIGVFGRALIYQLSQMMTMLSRSA